MAELKEVDISVTQLLLNSYPQLLLVLVVTSLEHSVSYNSYNNSVSLLLCTHYS